MGHTMLNVVVIAETPRSSNLADTYVDKTLAKGVPPTFASFLENIDNGGGSRTDNVICSEDEAGDTVDSWLDMTLAEAAHVNDLARGTAMCWIFVEGGRRSRELARVYAAIRHLRAADKGFVHVFVPNEVDGAWILA